MGNDTFISSLKEKIDDLNQQAWEARINDSPKALELSQESIKLARSIDYAKGLAEGLRSLGFAYVRLSKNDEAAKLLRESLSLFQSINDPKGQAVVYEYLGIIERNWGNLGHSLELLLKAYELIKQTEGSKEIEITCCYQIGVTYKHLGNHDNALDYLYQALSLSKETDLLLMEAYATNIIGSIYFDNGDYEKALECYQQGLVIRRQSNDKWGEAGSLDNIGFTYLKLNDLDKAIDYCKQSLAITQGTDDKKGESNALLHLAEIYQQAGDVEQASKFSNESLEIRKARGDKRGEAEALLFLAGLHKNINDVEDVQVNEWLSAALNIAGEIKAQDLLSKAYYNLHEYHSQKGNYKESLAKLEAHLQIEKELHKNTINQKVSNLEISHKAEVVSQRNKELTDLNEQIEKANAELRIESSLERVRTAAMAMKGRTDMITICRIIMEQLDILKVTGIRNVQTAIFDDIKRTYTNYECYRNPEKEVITDIPFDLHPVQKEFAIKMMKGPGEVYEHSFKGEEIRLWIENQKRTGEYIDPNLFDAESLDYYWYSLGPVALGISAYRPLSREEIDLFIRFKNVFELAYRRYLDIELAEAQAREAQIEAALERVRASSMAMHHSNDLIQVINIVKEQLIHLGIHFHAANFVTGYGGEGYTMWLASPGETFPEKIYVPQIEQKLFNNVTEAAEKGQEFITYTLSYEEKNIYFKHLFENTLMRNTSEENKRFVFDSKGMASSAVLLKRVRFNLMNLDLIPYTEEENSIIKRIAYVFEQSYIRFLDLQKAEAQAREAKIEMALERVRSNTMAMHHSEELKQVISVTFEQIKNLDIIIDSCIITLFIEGSDDLNNWVASAEQKYPHNVRVPYFKHPLFDKIALAKNKPGSYFTIKLSQKENQVFYKHIIENSDFGKIINEDRKKLVMNAESNIMSFANFRYTGLRVGNFRDHTYTDEENNIILRFANVFEQTYTRFLDLQKAEAQAREAQIEAALERVRSKTMAMQRSEELDSVIKTVYSELKHLDVSFARCFIMIFDEQKGATWWMGSPDDDLFHEGFYVQYHTHPPHLAYLKGWEERQQKWEYRLEGQIKKDWDEFVFNKTALSKLPPIVIQDMKSFEFAQLAASFENFGCMTTGGQERLSEESFSILSRFAKVFDQTYTRFNDLKQAEAQAREAKIEAALERVRSRSMAMHKSDELREVVAVLFTQLQHIGFDIKFCTIALIDKVNSTVEFWLSGFSQEILPESYHVPNLDHPFYQNFQNTFRQGTPYKVFELAGEEKRSYDKLWFTLTDFKKLPEPVKKPMMEMERVVLSCAFTKNGMLQIGGFEPLSDPDALIIQRFAKVFEQTYTRFLDLQKAEAQAREAKIEAALERTRTQSMLMQHSKELDDTLRVFHEQVLLLGIDSAFSFLWLPDEDKNRHIFWAAWGEDKNGSMVFKSKAINYPLDRNEPATAQCLVDWKSNEPVISYHVPPAAVENYFAAWQELITGVEQLKPEHFSGGLYYVEAFMKYGCFGVMVATDLAAEEKKILGRFAVEFERTYTRFLDLQKAEAQTREAWIEGALERVRARALAMQQPEELKDVAQVLRNEMGALGVEELETCSIYIHGDSSEKVECWYALQDPKHTEKKMVSDHFVLNLDDTWVGREMKKFYDSVEKQTSIVMQGMNRKEWIKYCYEHSPVFSGFYGETIPDRTYHLYKFSHGYIGAAAPGDISGESWKLLGRAASVFSLAYSRFKDLTQARNDLIKLKEEKKRAEDALTELQATQKQLIQSEKMASLGELTAGIAHEIQNPLNFVNNFSDVSNELLEEMKNELATGNTQQAIDIVKDVKVNLEKILHHGKRADAIVKGMLQHSRSSSGQKELTDINTLTDEYLRLAYHGLRAKDKFFNAKFETDLDPSINKINVVPQEIGRVILNLVNNSFYAVSEKKKNTGNGYEPSVTISTKKINDKVEIRVKDNGNGIPEKVLDKIFQPFFTTKPTGQGTGLGLSLSYDIITKGHDGEIKVETKEGEGSEFTITLPMN